ncbi:hypothetical protein NJF44_08305 [Pseudomonas guariconensis]|uniref:hypothetical protein n=1 Tax=Pseudomonas TaxID=286 RepID=UPI001CE3C917|nr:MULTISPECIES: hypothetical protein [Pseudomonas]MCO7641214.1 hypothetical protein [Pseudomonas sp. S 311-6]MCO7514909.1 hypothetical protein [Pseudomonas putida]MCO7565783.1 hypothetical protein [Pseudomonas mosselii]MCO7594036.1 hypothetical protein [Pseudomonas guariconensis]MCO7605240.1 hypothetical protein [Pseudomonas guariconensis]
MHPGNSRTSAARQAGSIIIWTSEEQESYTFHLPESGSGETVVFDIEEKTEEPRFIEMSGIPSAAIITLASRDKDENDQPKWWVTWKTTHAPSMLRRFEVYYFGNSYIEGDFIIEGLGILVTKKSTEEVKRDGLGSITVEISAAPPAA